MKIYFLIILLLISLLTNALAVNQPFAVFDRGDNFTDFISAQPQIDYPQSFICGISFRQSRWEKSMYNCNCMQTHIGYRCQWCINYFYSMSNAIRVTFCDYQNWHRQVNKQFEAGNTISGGWKQIKCPKGQYVSNIAVRLSTQQGVYVGFNGAQLACSNLSFNQTSIVQDNSTGWLSQMSKTPQNLFISKLKVQYTNSTPNNTKLTGGVFVFSPMVKIANIALTYPTAPVVSLKPFIIDSYNILSYYGSAIQRHTELDKNYTLKNTWTTQQQQIGAYMIADGVRAYPLTPEENGQRETFYEQNTDKFHFNQQIKTNINQYQAMSFVVNKCKMAKITYVIHKQEIDLPYEAVLTFSDISTGRILGTKTITGKWIGQIASTIETIVTEQNLPNCSVN